MVRHIRHVAAGWAASVTMRQGTAMTFLIREKLAPISR